MRVRTKICGFTRLQDAQTAWNLGVDALGMNFCITSPRCIRIEIASEICNLTPPFVSRVGVFVDPSADDVKAVLDRVELDLLQFHGREAGRFCASFARPFIKALPVGESFSLAEAEREYSHATALLLDSTSGGSGRVFDWDLWPDSGILPLILAGGLNPINVAAAIRATRPFAVDVSTGVEPDDNLSSAGVAGVAGVKDPVKIAAFLSQVSRCNESSG